MAFGFGFGLQFGSRGGGASGPANPAALTAALNALGFVITGGGTKESHTLGAGVDGFEVIGADEPTFERITIGERDHLGVLAQPPSTSQASYNRDLTNAAWTKESCTATWFASGGIAGGGYTRLTATGAHGTCYRTLTSGSANRTLRARVMAPDSNAGSVLLSHGKPTGSNLVANGAFGADTSGWAGANATLSVVSGKLRVTSTSATLARGYYTANVTVGKTYRALVGSGSMVSGSGSAILRVYGSATGGGPTLASLSVGTPAFFTPLISQINISCIINNPAGGGETADFDDISLYEIETTAVTPGSFQDIMLPAYTGENPRIAVRLTDSADTVDVYDLSPTKPDAGVPAYRWHAEQAGSPAAIDADSIVMTLAEAPASIDLTLLIKTPETLVDLGRVITITDASGDNLLQLRFESSSNRLNLQRRVSSISNSNIASSVWSANTVMKIDIQWDPTYCRFRIDDGSWVSEAGETLPTMTRVYLGSSIDFAWSCCTILSIVDNDGSIFGVAGTEFNDLALADYEATL